MGVRMPLKTGRGLWGGGIKFYSLHIAQLRGDSISAIFPLLIYLHLCVCLWVSPVVPPNPTLLLDSATLIASPITTQSWEKNKPRAHWNIAYLYLFLFSPLPSLYPPPHSPFSSSSILFYFFHHCKAEIGQDSTFCLEVSPTLHHKNQPTHPDKTKKIIPMLKLLPMCVKKNPNTLFVEMNRVYVSSFKGYYTITRVQKTCG